MAKTTRKIKPYIQKSVPLGGVEEAALKYESLRVILGGGKAVDHSLSGDFDLIDLSREGIKKSSLKSLSAYLGISLDTMSRLLHSSHRNIQRKKDDELLDTLKSEKVLELASFAQRGVEVLGNKESLAEWLHSPIAALGHKMPIDFLDTTFGIQLVLKVLGRLEQGVFS